MKSKKYNFFIKKAPFLMSQNNNESYDFRNTRLYELLQNLKPKQREKIVLILELEYSEKKKDYILLLRRINDHIKKNAQKQISKDELFGQIVASKKQRNHMVSELFKKICKILYSLNLLKDYEQEQTQTLADFFINADLNINIKYALDDIRNSLNKESKRTHDFHYRKMKLNEFHVIHNRSSRKYNSNFKTMNDNLDAFYAENKLRFLCEEVNRNRIIEQPSEVFPSESFKHYFLNLVQERNFFDSFSVEIYFHLYEMLTTNSEASYKNTAQIIKDAHQAFSPNLKNTLIRYLMNQCILFINKGINKTFYADDYLNHISALKSINKLLNKENKFPLGIFHNAIRAKLILKDPLIEDFINEIGNQLDTPNIDFIKKLHLILICFESNNPETAKTFLSQIVAIPKDDAFFVALYYKLSIQVFFHTENDLDLALNKAEALRKYSKRMHDKNELSISKHQGLTSFTLFFKRIVNTSKIANPLKWKKIKEDFIAKKSHIAYSDWLWSLIQNKKI